MTNLTSILKMLFPKRAELARTRVVDEALEAARWNKLVAELSQLRDLHPDLSPGQLVARFHSVYHPELTVSDQGDLMDFLIVTSI